MFTALKYCKEDRPDVFVAASGSLMGLALKQGTRAPVGCVHVLRMFPMSFYEFLDAMGESEILDLLLNNAWDAYSSVQTVLEKHLSEYIRVGGMPAAVLRYVQD